MMVPVPSSLMKPQTKSQLVFPVVVLPLPLFQRHLVMVELMVVLLQLVAPGLGLSESKSIRQQWINVLELSSTMKLF